MFVVFFWTWMRMLGDCPILVSSHDMLPGVHTDRTSQNFIVCPSYLMRQGRHPCISLRTIHSSKIQKFTFICLGIPGTHATRWLASVLIVFLKRLADFMKKMKFCTIPTWKNSIFYIGIQNQWYWPNISESCIDCWKCVGALLLCNFFEQELMILRQIHEINCAYTFLRGSCENGGGGGVLPLRPTRLVN